MNRSSSFNQQQSGCFDMPDDDSPRRLITHQHRNEPLTTEDLQQKKQEMDDLLSQAIHGLTFEERQKQQEILHGVDESIVEEETWLSSTLQDLDRYLSSAKKLRIYELAEGMDPDYVNRKAFRLMFLRANEYDPKAAADQILRFFESKHQLFGPEKLVKDITLEDLDEDDTVYIKMGLLQVAARDRSGRQILVHFAGLPGMELSMTTIKSWMRAQYFVVMRALQSEETQLRGTVSVWYGIGSFKNKANGKEYLESFTAISSVLPRKIQAIHICVDDPYQYVLYNPVVKQMNEILRARIRVLYGSQKECQDHLATFGISSQSIPVDDEGRMDYSRHMNWIRTCNVEDGLLDKGSLESIAAPNPNDVIFTAGRINNHFGNQRFLELIKDSAGDYDPGTTDETKREAVNEIIDKIHASGGRFLRQASPNDDTTNWEPLPPDLLRKRIMQAFRNQRRMTASRNDLNDTGTLIPGRPLPSDVIFGRSRRNTGTELLHSLIKENFEEYESLGRGVKMQLVETIMQTIRAQGGRFLQPSTVEPGSWFEVSHEAVRERISKYFRNHRRPSTKKTK